jgi:RNA polymerase sigma-70 factor, ECF subfamily
MRDDSWKPKANAAMDRYADGDDDAFGEVYTLLAPRLQAFLWRRTRDSSRAEELLHDTFLRMHANRRHFVHGAEVMPWAFAIARHMLIDDHRRSRPPPDPDAPACPLLDAVVAMRRLGRRVMEELERLPEAHREAFALVQIDGLSMAEAAQVLGTTVAAVKLRAFRTYEALRERLGDEVREELGDLP